MPRKIWTPTEIAYLREHFADTPTKELAKAMGRTYSSVCGRAATEGLRKSKAFLSDPELSGRGNLATHGKDSRYKKGQEPMNKGRKQTEYMSPTAIARTKKTRFKKGSLPHNTRQDGDISVRVNKGNWPYKWIRVSLGKWRELHRVTWEQHHGKIPKGYNVVFKDGDSLNCDIDNLELVSRAENMSRNVYGMVSLRPHSTNLINNTKTLNYEYR
jgi:hypothetical protein